MEMLLHWDEQLFFWIFEGWRADWLTPVMVFLSDALKSLPARVGVLLFWGWMVWRGGKLRQFALLLVPVLILTNETSDWLKAWVGRERPCVALPIEPITGRLTSGSFPSAHAANMGAVVALAGAIGGWRQALYWGWLPLMVGLSRVYVGVHYPSDVLGGWLLGALYGWGVGWLWCKITARRVSTPSESSPSSRGE
ncbi:undecaprenyl-diphosphatase [Armatimonadetes bacterium GBS]|jgi:undecaprenyl-diphosphatase|nr:MAG: phosphatase PAP2 family protein [Fimbriimonadales bacterium]CUU05565.1 undecaprenyl-diphosphatase [Armatimonadetes bacterium GBS]CUU36173.1 undecaprenyl-diphosphatase [Armatimonadetes bacterium GXS]